MNARILIAATLLAACGCATELGSYGQTRDQLDEYVITKPLAQAWPAALRFLNERGYSPVGEDRERIGLSRMGSWSTAASKGSETQIDGSRWQADTAEDTMGRRYRIIGLDLGADTCRIGFFKLAPRGGVVVAPSDETGRETMLRDPTIELAFVQTIDPAAAARMRPKSGGFF